MLKRMFSKINVMNGIFSVLLIMFLLLPCITGFSSHPWLSIAGILLHFVLVVAFAMFTDAGRSPLRQKAIQVDRQK